MSVSLLLATAVSLAFILLIARQLALPNRGGPIALMTSILFLFFSLLFSTPALFVQAALTSAVIASCLAFGAGRRAAVIACSAAALAAFAITPALESTVRRGWERIQSAYEPTPNPRSTESGRRGFVAESKQTKPSNAVEVKTDDAPVTPTVVTTAAHATTTDERVRALKNLHNDCRLIFIAANGNGKIRMRLISPDRVRLPDILTEIDSSDSTAIASAASSRSTATEPPIERSNAAKTAQVLVEEGKKTPSTRYPGRLLEEEYGSQRGNTARWSVERLQLVGVVVHTQPVAYVTEFPPAVVKEEFPKRSLDDFETLALERLNAGENLVTDIDDSRIRMLGAIRAEASCLKCHTVRVGELLGALSYDLKRLSPPPARRRPAQPADPIRPIEVY